MAMRPRGGGRGGPSRPSRDTAAPSARHAVYETFQPVSERERDEEAEKLLIYLPGFEKQNIKVSTEGKSTVRVQGERLVTGNKWNLFREEFHAPDDCNMRGIRARFENGILTIKMPIITKKISPPTATIPPPPPQVDDNQTQKQQPDFSPKITQHQPIPPKGTDEEELNPRISQKTAQTSVGSQSSTKGAFQAMPAGLKDDYRQKQISPPKPSPLQPINPLIGTTNQDDFPAKMGGPIQPKPRVDYQDDFPAYKTLHDIDSQKQQMLHKDHQDESLLPPKPKVIAPFLVDQEKFSTGEEQQKIMPLPFIGEVKGKGITTPTPAFEGTKMEERTRIVNEQTPSISGSGGDFGLGKYKEAFKGFADLKEERQLLVNAGVAVLVILALGAHIYNTVGTKKSD